MVAEGTERSLDLSTDESSQNSGRLLEDFLNKSDFQSSFRKDILPQPNLFPANDELLEQLLTGERAAPVLLRGDNVQYSKTDFRDLTIHADEVNGSIVVRDNKTGNVTKVVHPDGKTMEFEYDAQKNLTKIKYKSGSYYEKDPTNDVWTLHSKHATDNLGQAAIKVERDGTLVFVSQDGNHVMITRRDGEIGSVDIENGRVTKAGYAGRGTREFEYDENGLTKVKEKDGTYWQNETDGTWKSYDPKGNPTGRSMGKIEIDETGDLTMTSVDGKHETMYMPNGTIYRKENGRVTRIERK